MLDFINQTIDLLTRTPGDLVYFLIVLFAIEAMLGLAVVRARRTGWTRQLRLIALAAGVMLIGRIALIGVGLLAVQNQTLFATALIPPLERYVDLISLTFLALAFVPLLRERGQLGLGLTAIMLVAATIFYAVSATQWYNLSAVPNQFYNTTSQETIWQAWSLAVAALAAAAVWLSRDETFGLTFAAFLTLALGSLLQLILSDAQSNVAGWARLAQLIAYPMFAVVVYQITEATTDSPQLTIAPAYPLLPAYSESTEQAWGALTTIQNLSTSPALEDSLQRTAAVLAQFLQADLSAIGLLNQNPNVIDIAAVHHPGAAPTRGAAILLDRHPLIQRVLDLRQPIALDKTSAPPEMSNLYGLMGSFVVGPTIIAPLIDDRTPLGIVLLGRSDGGQAWAAVGCGTRADRGQSHRGDVDGARESPALCAPHRRIGDHACASRKPKPPSGAPPWRRSCSNRRPMLTRPPCEWLRWPPCKKLSTAQNTTRSSSCKTSEIYSCARPRTIRPS